MQIKLAASDYDGTLYQADEIRLENIAGVRAWRVKGNKFGVITGRDYGMLVPQLQSFGIEFDFAVCNNGAIIFDEKGSVLWQKCIPVPLLQAIAQEPCTQSSLHFAFSAAQRTYICHEREGSWIGREAKKWKFPLQKIQEDGISSLQDIQQFSLGFETAEESQAVSEVLNREFGEAVHAYPNRGSLDITPAGESKRQGIEELIDLMKWENPEIFVIGDETNDLPMIEAFHGFTVDSAREVIKARARASFASVGAMLMNFLQA